MRRSSRRTAGVVGLLALGVLWCAVPSGALPGTAASSNLPVPAAWGPKPSVSYTSVACAAVGSCTTIGLFAGAHRDQYPASDVEKAGSWSTPTTFALPSNGESVTFGLGFRSIACPAQGSCVAVGSYAATGKGIAPMVAVESGGAWGAATDPISLPSGTRSAILTGVWCEAVGSCIAVGSTFSGGGFFVQDVGGSWQSPIDLPIPSNLAVAKPVTAIPRAIDCTDTTDCVVVGGFQGPSEGSSELGMVDIERSGTWTTKVYVGPVIPGYGSELSVDTVTCTSLESCVGGGTLLTKGNALVPFAIEDTSGKWGPVTVLPWRFAWPESDGGSLNDVACASASRCVAVGELQGRSYGNTSGDGGAFPVAYTYAAGHWSPPALIEPPARPSPSGGAVLSAIACPSLHGCVAVGSTTPRASPAVDQYPYAAVIAPISAASPPSAPIGLDVGKARGVFQVLWSMSMPEGGAPIIRFSVTAASPGERRLSCVSVAFSCRLNGVAPHHRYTISVTATNAVGRSGPAAHGIYLGE